MNIAVITEVSTKERNKDVIAALEQIKAEGKAFAVYNIGMKGIGEEAELSYIQTGFLTALFLSANCADVVVGGCGTGQGYLNSALQYPGVFGAVVESPLDPWLFRQINDGNCLSLALNKGYGWAGDVNLKFLLERFLQAPAGGGYPAHRAEPQRAYRQRLKALSAKTHKPFAAIIEEMEDADILPALTFPGVMETFRKLSKNAEITAAIEKRLANAK